MKKDLVMILVFNKQYRQEEKLFRELKSKIKKSQSIATYLAQSEVYKLDSIDLYFDVDEYLLTVKDKSGNVIVELNCKYAGAPYNDEMELANARNNMFSALLDAARKQYNKRVEKEKLEQATKKAQAKIAEKKKAKKEQALKEAAVTKAYERLKGL